MAVGGGGGGGGGGGWGGGGGGVTWRSAIVAVVVAVIVAGAASRVNRRVGVRWPGREAVLDEVIDVDLDTGTPARAVASLGARTRAKFVMEASCAAAAEAAWA